MGGIETDCPTESIADGSTRTPGAEVAHIAFTETNPHTETFKSLLRTMDLDVFQFSPIHEFILRLSSTSPKEQNL